MRKPAFLLAMALLGGCVHTETSMLTPNTAIISGRGNAFANSADVVQKLLQEAAKIGHERGYTHFQVLDAQDASSQGMYYQPGQTNTTGMVTANCMGGNCTAFGNSNTYSTPGYAVPIFKPGADATVRFFHESEVAPGTPVWRISDILAEAE